MTKQNIYCPICTELTVLKSDFECICQNCKVHYFIVWKKTPNNNLFHQLHIRS